MQRKGVGVQSQRKAFTALGAMCRYAVEGGLLQTNPVSRLRLPTAEPRPIEPLSPEAVEAIRAKLDSQSATLISLIAYAGLRPEEACGLRWRNVGRKLFVEEVAWGRPGKQGFRRPVALLDELAGDLRKWRLRCGRPEPNERVIGLGEGEYTRWQQRIYRPAVEALELGNTEAYRLRHSFVSLLIYETGNLVWVAQQAGHSPQTCLRHYARIFSEFDPTVGFDANERIRLARERLHERLSKAG